MGGMWETGRQNRNDWLPEKTGMVLFYRPEMRPRRSSAIKPRELVKSDTSFANETCYNALHALPQKTEAARLCYRIARIVDFADRSGAAILAPPALSRAGRGRIPGL
jgi:hypothetical protein